MTVFEKIEATSCDCDRVVDALASVREALDAALALAAPVAETEIVPLHAARGRVLAEPVTAGADMPRFDNSGMDGYALRHADLRGDEWLSVVGTCAAGDEMTDLPPGVAMRIYTGAPVPRGADTVVMQESVARTAKGIRPVSLTARGANIRKRGSDRHAGDAMLPRGTVLGAKAVAVCAGAGAGHVAVYRRPRVALLLTGDEVTPTGAPLQAGAIWDVNGPMLAALCHDAGVALVDKRTVPDTRAALSAHLSDLVGRVDMIVTSGGVSVGDRDHVSGALHDIEAEIAVAGVAIKPGKPVTVARRDGCLILGLPGNPVSAFVTWHVLGRPVASRLSGRRDTGVTSRHVRASAPLSHKPGRCEYRPARILGYDGDGHQVIGCADRMRSADLGPLIDADGLILLPAEVERVQQGDLLEFLPFNGTD